MASKRPVFPPPNMANLDSIYRDIHYYSVDSQRTGQQAYKGAIDDAEAQKLLDRTKEMTTKCLGNVKTSLKTHGDLILRRWTKKSRKQRATLLSNVATSCFGEIDPASSTLSKDSWTWAPWVRPQTFAEDRMVLLSLLHVRTSFPMQLWAAFDTIQTADVFDNSKVPIPFNSKFVQMFGEHYGRLADFSIELVYSRATLGFPRAFCAFSAQYRIALMLQEVVKAIVAEEPPTGDSEWLATMSHGMHGHEAAWSPYTNPGFTAPPCGLDTDAMLAAARDRFNKIVDDIEIMQTDPEYMRQYVLTTKADIRWDAKIPSSLKWDYVSENIMFTWTHSLSMWHSIYDACQQLHDACAQNDGSTTTRPGATLSLETSKAFTHFAKLLMTMMMDIQMPEFEAALLDMNGMKSYSKKVVTHNEIYNVDLQGKSSDSDEHSARILKAWQALKNSPPNSNLYSASDRLDKLEDELASAPFDKRVDDQLSSLALMDALRLSLLWSQVTITQSVPVDTQVSADSQERPAKTHIISLDYLDRQDDSVDDAYGKRLGPPLRAFCEQSPPQGTQGSVNLEKMIKSRALLADFWQQVRTEHAKYWSYNYGNQSIPSRLIASMEFDLSSEYLTAAEEEREQLETELQRKERTAGVKKNSTLQTEWGAAAAPAASLAQAKRTKVKTAAAPEQRAEYDLDADDASAEPEPLRIAVKPESISVFDKMFRSAGLASVRWVQLVQALVDAGMTATQVPGSGVKFSNKDGSIVFDKPHPKPDVSAVMLRRHVGRRLNKWFGWERETFILRERS